MTSRVLLAYDGTPQSETALEYALDERADDQLVLLRVIDPAEAGYGSTMTVTTLSEEWYEDAKAAAKKTLAEARQRAETEGVPVETDTAVGSPANAIIEYAEEHDVDHIITGSHGRSGVSRILLGSVAETVVRRSPVPVTVVR